MRDRESCDLAASGHLIHVSHLDADYHAEASRAGLGQSLALSIGERDPLQCVDEELQWSASHYRHECEAVRIRDCPNLNESKHLV